MDRDVHTAFAEPAGPDLGVCVEPQQSPQTRHPEVVIVGAGFAGAMLALTLGRQGVDTVVVDPHAVHPPDFRCEKLAAHQVALLAELDALSCLEVAAGQAAEPEKGAANLLQRGLRYDAMVNALRDAWPRSVRFIQGRVAEAATGAGGQRIVLSNGDVVQARVLVLATGPGERLRASLGVRRRIVRERHSVCIGFSLRPTDVEAAPLQGLTHQGERAGDGMAFASLFPLDDALRVNLFSYLDPREPWTRALREDPLGGLFSVMPGLKRKLGEVSLVGPVEIRPTDLYETEGCRQPGVVLIGDAFLTSCPATGTGVTRILTDVRQLARTHIPLWLSSPGMDADKIGAFYDDPAKRAVDQAAMRRAETGRASALQTSLRWRAYRSLAKLKRSTPLRLARAAARPGARAPQRAQVVPPRTAPPSLLRGQMVQVRSREEILATLDASGALDGLPFMPEMARFCGARMRVARRAEKTCVEGHGLRRMQATVLLEAARCDGAAHDGCQRNCMMFWKEAWLKPVSDTPAAARETASPAAPPSALERLPTRVGERYHCQSTALATATAHLPRWNYAPLFNDVARGELTPLGLARILARTVANRARRLIGLGELGALAGKATRPAKGELGLQPGDWVRIKPAEEIKAALDASSRNQGLTFEPEMSLYVGGTYRVDFPVSRIINEETGKMVRLSRTVALDGLACQGLCVKNCPRANTLYWREAWLDRVEAPSKESAA